MPDQITQPTPSVPPQTEEEKKKKALESIGKIYGGDSEQQKKEEYMKGLFHGDVPGMAERRKKLTQERGPQTDV